MITWVVGAACGGLHAVPAAFLTTWLMMSGVALGGNVRPCVDPDCSPVDAIRAVGGEANDCVVVTLVVTLVVAFVIIARRASSAVHPGIGP